MIDLAVATLGLALAVEPCVGPARALPSRVRGIVLPLHDADPRRSYRAAVREIRSTGANAVSLMPTWDMATVSTPVVVPGSARVKRDGKLLDLPVTFEERAPRKE